MPRMAPRIHRHEPVCPTLRHDGELDPPRVAPGRMICFDCRDQVEEDLVELPGLYELCAYMLDLRRHHMRERVSGHRPHGIALNDTVVAIRSDILGVLASWCALVSNERGVPGPDELSIRRLTTFLAVHLNWLTEQPSAPDLVDELAELSRSATEALRPSAGHSLELGRCARPDCDRIVRAEGHAEGEPPYQVSCEAGHVWTPDQWLLLWGGPRKTTTEGAE